MTTPAQSIKIEIPLNWIRTSLPLTFCSERTIVGAGLHSEAVNELKKAASLSGDSPLYTAQVAVALAVEGRSGDALRIAHELEAISRKRYVSPYGLAQIYAASNKKEDTFKWLQAAYEDHAVWMGYLAVDPIFDRYRSDERFKDLLRRVGLP